MGPYCLSKWMDAGTPCVDFDFETGNISYKGEAGKLSHKGETDKLCYKGETGKLSYKVKQANYNNAANHVDLHGVTCLASTLRARPSYAGVVGGVGGHTELSWIIGIAGRPYYPG